MDDELVLLTSYFNLADGRRQDTADTFRVDPSVPSGTSPDGNAALYIVTEASAGGHMGPRARRLAADTVAWEYATHSDDPPAARLKAALRTAHNEVLREFDGHVAVGLSVIAVEGETVYLGQVAPSQVYVVHDGSLHSISASVDGPSPFARAMGSSAGPRISVFRDQIGVDDVLSLCSSWYHRGVDPADLRECFGAGTADDIAQCLFDVAKQHDERSVTVVVIEAVPASALEAESVDDETPGFMEQVDSAVQALAGVGRMLWEEFRTPSMVAETNGRSAEANLPDLTPSGAQPHGASAAAANPDLDYEPWPGTPAQPTQELSTDHQNQHTAEMPLPGFTEETEPDVSYERRSRPSFDEPTEEIQTRRDQSTDEVPIVPADGTVADATLLDAPFPDSRQRTEMYDRPLEEPGRGTEQTVDQPIDEPGRGTGAHPAGRTAPPAFTRRTRREPAAEQAAELEQVNSRLQSGPDMEDVIPPVQAFPDTSTTEPSRIYATSKDIQAVNKRPRRLGGISRPARDSLSGPPVIRPGLGSVDLERPTSRPGPPAVIWLGIALIFLLAAGALFVYYRNHRHTVTDPYPALARKDIQLALASKTPSNQDLYLAKAKRNIARAQQAGALPSTIRHLKSSVLTASDTLHHITRLYNGNVTMLSDFGKYPNAKPAQIATAPGLVFVLDAGRKAVFSITPNATSNPALIVGAGDTVSGFTVGTPLQLAAADNTALVFDDHNTLVRATGGTKTATSLTQATQTETIKSMSSSTPDVYLLDTANSQVWRYPQAVTGYESPPAGWWDSNPPNLSRAISIVLDGTDLFILQSDGTILKFDYSANPQKFTKPNLKTPLANPVAFATGKGLNYIWVADPAHARILQLDKSGNYVRTYRSATSTMDFRQVTSLSVSQDGKTLYILSSSKIYDFATSK